jgi:hypothetical protein
MTPQNTHFKGMSAATTLAANTIEAIQSGHQGEVMDRNSQGKHEAQLLIQRAIFGDGENGERTVHFEQVSPPPAASVEHIVDKHIHKQ